MSKVKRIFLLSVIAIILMQTSLYNVIYAFEYQIQEPPSMVKVEPRNEDEPPIGYNEFDRHYIDLTWNVNYPQYATNGFLNFYLREITKPYRPTKARTLKEGNVSGNINNYRLKELDSGTIYYVDMTAYHTYVVDNSTFSSPESAPSNRVKVMTDIDINAYSYGTNQIKIEWDDVWNSGGRIDYKLYVSENSSFTNTPPIFIGQAQIGQDRPVTVNEATGKLEYIHTVRDPGRVYYIRIEPDIQEVELRKSTYTRTVTVSSFILVRTTKMSTTTDGVIWRMEWSPVVTGLSDENIKVVYHVYRGSVDSNALPQYMSAVDGTNFFVTLPHGDSQNYFIIRAIVTRNGEDLYRGIRIESDRIIVGEQEVSSRPVSPEIVNLFERVQGDTIISYEDELKPHSATVLWRVPKRADGQTDMDVLYDIWLIDDPNLIDNPPARTHIAKDARMGSENYIFNGNNLVGYKYKIEGLTPNNTYYLKIVAKKQFVEYVNDVLQPVVYNSDPAYKVIITPAEGPIDQPQVPARPPLTVKKDAEGMDMITHNSVTIQLKNLWYEKYDHQANRWDYIRTEKLNEHDEPPFDPLTEEVDDFNYRMVSYDSGVTIDVGCLNFTEGMSYEVLNTALANKIINFPTTPNDPLEDPKLNPNNRRHNIDITLTNLMPNTMYIIWVRASRLSVNLTSGPSDPIIITTKPVIVPPIEQPIVPSFNYNLASDKYIDLGWEFVPGYNYYIKYGLEDNINRAIGNIEIKPEDLYDSIYYRVRDLQPDKLYYFWIQAESVNQGGETKKSDWSDSYSVRTLKYIPPRTPIGFGIKNSSDAITKDSIAYEWMQEESMEYIIELSRSLDYTESTEYIVGKGFEYTVSGLLSNHRYYARLYAFDPTTNLRSPPTQTITVRTKTSSDDYDSDQEIDDQITGDYVEKDEVIVNGVWNVRITGVNGDRFIESLRHDKRLDYRIDLTNPPDKYKKVNILISDRVFMALTRFGKNIIFETDDKSVIIRPGVITSEISNPLIRRTSRVDYEISISKPEGFKTDAKNMVFKKEVGKIEIGAVDGGTLLPFNTLLKPLKVVVKYNESGWYREGKTSGFVYDPNTSLWDKLNTFAVYYVDWLSGEVLFESIKTGNMTIAEIGRDFFDDIYYHRFETSINNVASLYQLKGVRGRIFQPDIYASLSDTVRFMFDVLNYDYNQSFMVDAVKTGLVKREDAHNPNRNCTVKEAYHMIIRVYEIKTGQMLDNTTRTGFIRQNGMSVVRNGVIVPQSEIITRGEVMALIEKILIYTGELE
ncbi:UNVERIFIED_CONTAM: hypothetical protein Cloal_1007 [Acetivibrio alkalicellulosi]